MRSAERNTGTRWVALLAGIAISGCVDEKIVEVPREIYDPPAAEAIGMLGYSDQASSLTSCGNCHVGPQGQWQESAHADAWAGLQDSGHAQEFCEGCHTVNELGNTLAETAGYNAVPEDRYHDVQCESCHGPGLDHVEEPGANSMLAPLDVGLDNTEGCGECHQGAHHPFAEQWLLSGHSGVNFASERDGCNACHSGGGALEAWNVRTSYIEQDGDALSITCGVCHDPHGSDFEGQLRFPVGGVPIEQNLCSQCHDRRTVPDPGSSHGLHPHSPETAMLSGEAGFFFPGMIIDRGDIIATHGSGANERLCAGCHVVSTTITDEATGEFVFEAVGHTFQAAPCVDENGIPTGEDCGIATTDRDYESSCATSGCHGSASGAQAVMLTATLRFENLAEELMALLIQVDPGLEEPGGEIDPEDGVITTAEGAFFNHSLAEFGGTDRPSPLLAYAAAAAHNPFLTEQLLLASIDAVETEYGVSASPQLNRSRTFLVDGATQ
jgi:predicted CXXCH cytochrome family protein